VHIFKIIKIILGFTFIGIFVYITLIYDKEISSLIGKKAYFYSELILISLLSILLLFRILLTIIDRKYDTFIITNKRLIQTDQHFIFGHTLETVYISDIVDIKAYRPGFCAMLFRFGHLQIETSAGTKDFEIKFMPHTSELVQTIQNLRQGTFNMNQNTNTTHQKKEHKGAITYFL